MRPGVAGPGTLTAGRARPVTDRTAKADDGRRYRLHPTPEQAEVLTGWAHTCRAVWNVALEQRQFAWSQRRHTLRAVEQCAHLTQARAELPWMAELPAQAGQQVLGIWTRRFVPRAPRRPARSVTSGTRSLGPAA